MFYLGRKLKPLFLLCKNYLLKSIPMLVKGGNPAFDIITVITLHIWESYPIITVLFLQIELCDFTQRYAKNAIVKVFIVDPGDEITVQRGLIGRKIGF